MNELETSGSAAVVLIGNDVAAAQTILRSLSPNPGFSVVVALEAADLVLALKTTSALPVDEVKGETSLAPDRVYVVPPRVQAVLQRDSLVVEETPGPGRVDRLLRSLADQFGRSGTVVVLGGKDGDGALGIKRVREGGGLTICQRVEDGPFAELPRAALLTGMVDLVLALGDIAPRLQANQDPDRIPDVAHADDTLRDILAMIRIRTGNDFTGYKRATLYRRLARRMQVCQTETVLEYHRLLREHPNELASLLRDFLISVTNFFRDPDAFEALTQLVLPRIFRGKRAGDQVRVWVAGCATGEEAYSLGMLLADFASQLAEPPQLQIFATDIDEEALHEARAGLYPEQIETDVSQQRLERYFAREPGGYRVSKELREMMLFSPHNVLRDPPFSRLDLVSCRNLLIYLNRDAQDRVLNTFHFALRTEGLLFLGSSESAEGMHQFSALDAKSRIFERRIAPSAISTDALVTTARWLPVPAPFPSSTGDRPSIGTFGELHFRAVELFGPPSVLVNEDLDVVHVSEHAGKFLAVSGGEPTRQILRMVHPALRFELRGAIYAARQPDRGSDTRVVRFDDDGKPRAIEIRVRTIDLKEAGRHTMLVMFDELDQPHDKIERDPQGQTIEPVMHELEDELHRTRDQLRTTIEQYETSLEELKASNEELHAINEELRSATEELETGKEELQSVNEELTTLNHELKIKVDEVGRANSDLQNLMTSTDIGVLFLDRQLCIKRFTPRIQDLFNIIPSDLGRPLAHVTHRLDDPDLAQAAAQVLLDLRTTDREVHTTDGRGFLVRFLPYRSLEDRIEGVVVTFVDITELKAAKAAQLSTATALATSEERLSAALAAAPIAVFSHDGSLQPIWAYLEGKQLEPRAVAGLFAERDGARYAESIRDVFASGAGQRVELELAGGRTFDFRIEPRRENHRVTGVTSVGFDITPSKTAERSLRDTDRHKDEFLAILSHELRNPLTPLRIAFDVAKLASNDPAQLRKSLAIMDRQLQVLMRLVDDLLDVSRIAQGKIQLLQTTLDLVRVVEAALETTRPTIDDHRHKIDVELPRDRVVVIGDFTRLTQVLTNLLMNAAKYTPEGGTLGLRILRNDSRGTVQIVISDNGIGIAPDVLPHVFDMFVQSSDGADRRQGGLGIGLNIARRIVELHGGTVTAHSDGTGTGSTFTVELPMATPD